MALKLFSVYILEKESRTAKNKKKQNKHNSTLNSLTFMPAILIRIFRYCLQSLLTHSDLKYLRLLSTHTHLPVP